MEKPKLIFLLNDFYRESGNGGGIITPFNSGNPSNFLYDYLGTRLKNMRQIDLRPSLEIYSADEAVLHTQDRSYHFRIGDIEDVVRLAGLEKFSGKFRERDFKDLDSVGLVVAYTNDKDYSEDVLKRLRDSFDVETIRWVKPRQRFTF